MSQGFVNSNNIPIPVPIGNGGMGASSAAGALTNLGLGTPSGTGNVLLQNSPLIITPNTVGVTNGSNAATGSDGEFIDSGVTAIVALNASTVVQPITSIILSAGDWDLKSSLSTSLSANTTTTINAYVATTPTGTTTFGSTFYTYFSFNASTSGVGNTTLSPFGRFSITTTTTIYLTCGAAWTGGAPGVAGQLTARRVR